MKPIYEPKGAAKEYGDYALNIYTGCPHRCYYCFAPSVLHRQRDVFHNHVEPRKNIVEETRRQIEREGITGKLIHLCFTCDPYPTGYDTTPTREIIKAIKDSGNNVQILTKGDGTRDFDLLDSGDWYGITYDGTDNIHGSAPYVLIDCIRKAKQKGIKTWVSCEPVIDDLSVKMLIDNYNLLFDKVKIGKLNYHPSEIDWKKFGNDIEQLCQSWGLNYYIKESLRAEMNKGR